MSMDLSWQNEWILGGERGVYAIESLVMTGKWSDGEKWLDKRDGAREVSEQKMLSLSPDEFVCLHVKLKEERTKKWRGRVIRSIIEVNIVIASY